MFPPVKEKMKYKTRLKGAPFAEKTSREPHITSERVLATDFNPGVRRVTWRLSDEAEPKLDNTTPWMVQEMNEDAGEMRRLTIEFEVPASMDFTMVKNFVTQLKTMLQGFRTPMRIVDWSTS